MGQIFETSGISLERNLFIGKIINDNNVIHSCKTSQHLRKRLLVTLLFLASSDLSPQAILGSTVRLVLIERIMTSYNICIAIYDC